MGFIMQNKGKISNLGAKRSRKDIAYDKGGKPCKISSNKVIYTTYTHKNKYK